MKSYKLPVNLLLIAVICVGTLTNCDIFSERDRTYQGPPQVEFFPLNPAPVETNETVTLNAQLIGHQRGSDLTLNVIVVDSLTTAGSDVYSLPSSTVTIPADSSSAAFTFNVTNSNIQDGDTKVLTLELQGTDEVKAAPNLNKSTITIRPPAAQ